jgi:hypothetical protein
MVICIIGLGLGSTKNLQTDTAASDDNAIIFALLAVICGIVAPMLFACGGITVRTWSEYYNFNSNIMTIS